MKMKKVLLSMTLLIFMICLHGSISSAAETNEMERLDYWDITKEYTVTKQDVTYHAYLSKDKEKSWIFKADVAKDKKNISVVIPEKIENAPVAMLGFISDFYDIYVPKLGLPGWDKENVEGWEAYITFFGEIIEPWHGEESQIANVKEIVVPDTVISIRRAAFAYVSSLEYIRLSKQIRELDEFVLAGCTKLKKIDFPASVRILAPTVFRGCKKLSGLSHESKVLVNDTITYDGKIVINQTEKTLIQVMPDAKKITIPAEVKWIEPTAFKNCSLQTVKVAKKSKSFAVHKRCLYRKKEGQLVLVFGKGSTVTLSKKIKEIGEDVATAKYKIKKLIIPKKMKRYDNWKKPYVTNNKKVKIYYCGKRIR